MMRTFEVEAMRQDTPTCKTMRLRPADGKPLFPFKPGQFVNLYLPRKGKKLGICRSYTIASPPGGSGGIDITFRLKGAFTKRLWKLEAGDRLSVLGPLGKFAFDPADCPKGKAVFIGGGIGMAGLMSAIRHVSSRGLPVRMKVIYSNRHHDDFPFRSELERGGVKAVFTLTGERRPPGWKGETGRLTLLVLKRHLSVPDRRDSTFYVCGSDGFVKDVHALLIKLGVADKRIKKEGFG